MRPNRQRYERTPRSSNIDARRLLDERQLLLQEVERLRVQNAHLLSELQETERLTQPREDVAQLVRRVEELTRDLSRVQQRTALEVEEARAAERARQLASLGDVLDSVRAGLQMSSASSADPWRSGMLGIERQLLALFRAEGAAVIGERGEPYDPVVHEGVAIVTDSGLEAGRIAEVVRCGIVLQDGRVARTAQVCIAA